MTSGEATMTQDVLLIDVPYHLGNHRWNVGNGPEAILTAGAETALAEAGARVERATLELPAAVTDHPATSEVGRVFALARLLAVQIRSASLRGQIPVMLAGDCTCCLGALAGIGATGTGVVWLDTHGDLNTPDTTTSGFLAGMPLAAATGRGWQGMCRTLPGYGVVPLERVLLVGVRSLDPPEAELITKEKVLQATGQDAGELQHELERLAHRIRPGGGLYLHIDLDVLDTSVGTASIFSEPGGLLTAQVVAAVEAAGRVAPIRAVSLTAYDPAADPDGGVANAAVEILRAVGRALGNGG